MPNEEIQNCIDAWMKIKSAHSRKLALEQMNSVLNSIQMESEIKDNTGRSFVEYHNASTSHTVIAGNICDDNIISKMPLVDLIFTSPPYNADIKYDIYKDNVSYEEYVLFLEKSIRACDKVLSSGGRFIINIRDIKVSMGVRKPIIIPLDNIFSSLGYVYQGVHIWYKGREESSTAWGSFMKSDNPSIIDLYEYVYVFRKYGNRSKGYDDINKTEFIESVMGIWKIRPVKKINCIKENIMNHPCPFPIELPRRVIRLYSHVGDVVLDPFAGVMSTALAALQTGRNSVSVDISKEYCESGVNRILKEINSDIMMNASVIYPGEQQ